MPAEAADGKAFQCMICGLLVSKLHRRVDWKMHVFKDLQSYVCVWQSCQSSLKRVGKRADWEHHEITEHCMDENWLRETFDGRKCPLCLKPLMVSIRGFFVHLGKHLEAISLAALPYDTSSDTDNDSGNESSSEVSPVDWLLREGENKPLFDDGDVTSNGSDVRKQDDVQALGDEIVRCICSQSIYPGPLASSLRRYPNQIDQATSISVENGNFFIQCDRCRVWQHAGCVDIDYESLVPDQYCCEQCKPELHKIRDHEGYEPDLFVAVTNDSARRRFSYYLPVHATYLSRE